VWPTKQTLSYSLDLTPRRQFSPPSFITSSATKRSSTDYERRSTVSTPLESRYQAGTSKRWVISMRASVRCSDCHLPFRADHRWMRGKTLTHPKEELLDHSACSIAVRSSTLITGASYFPEGTSISIHPFTVHRDPRNFSPFTDEFWPERWLVAQGSMELPSSTLERDFVHNSAAFIPFSYGK